MEGWKWIEVAANFPFGHDQGLRRLEGSPADLTAEEQASVDALHAEYDTLQEKYEDADELPDEVDARLGELEEALEAFENRPDIFKPAEMVHAGAFVSIDAEGGLQVVRRSCVVVSAVRTRPHSSRRPPSPIPSVVQERRTPMVGTRIHRRPRVPRSPSPGKRAPRRTKTMSSGRCPTGSSPS